ncbi:hypothetical protein MGYG_07092 [Nannizzia gypsea CBS 118893]|uniref:Uncharacterized protein n=1 Tax=Arthroderma gypseum (strain ATCC MYA-4604 / CBS 118893) TaxID=535722 RepID=E4V220_ARTGP|nr:hypothetical protein MGYG_07092 [Nannizzia gypsea CBS 118893]EFR04085.1 hypothetical protein MGYG_07092 [Nannizzia gypsea CBS 118893]
MTGQGEEDAAGWSRGKEEERKRGRGRRRRRREKRRIRSRRRDESDGWATRSACSSMDKPKYWACFDARFPTPAHVRISAWLDQWTAGGLSANATGQLIPPSCGPFAVGDRLAGDGCAPCWPRLLGRAISLPLYGDALYLRRRPAMSLHLHLQLHPHLRQITI